MSVALTTTVINNGPRNLNLLFSGQGDGQGQLNKVLIVDNTVYNPGAGKTPRIDRITSDVGYGIVTLYWDAAVPQPFTILGGTGQTFDYRESGGINTPNIEGVTGNILMSTTGFEAGSSFTLKLDMVK